MARKKPNLRDLSVMQCLNEVKDCIAWLMENVEDKDEALQRLESISDALQNLSVMAEQADEDLKMVLMFIENDGVLKRKTKKTIH